MALQAARHRSVETIRYSSVCLPWYYKPAESLAREGVVLLCLDEKTRIHALGNKLPDRDPEPSQPRLREFDSVRHGLVYLTLALDTATQLPHLTTSVCLLRAASILPPMQEHLWLWHIQHHPRMPSDHLLANFHHGILTTCLRDTALPGFPSVLLQSTGARESTVRLDLMLLARRNRNTSSSSLFRVDPHQNSEDHGRFAQNRHFACQSRCPRMRQQTTSRSRSLWGDLRSGRSSQARQP